MKFSKNRTKIIDFFDNHELAKVLLAVSIVLVFTPILIISFPFAFFYFCLDSNNKQYLICGFFHKKYHIVKRTKITGTPHILISHFDTKCIKCGQQWDDTKKEIMG